MVSLKGEIPLLNSTGLLGSEGPLIVTYDVESDEVDVGSLEIPQVDGLVGDVGVPDLSLVPDLGSVGVPELLGDGLALDIPLDGVIGDTGIPEVSFDADLGSLVPDATSGDLDGLIGGIGVPDLTLEQDLLGSPVGVPDLTGDDVTADIPLDGLIGDTGIPEVTFDFDLGSLLPDVAGGDLTDVIPQLDGLGGVGVPDLSLDAVPEVGSLVEGLGLPLDLTVG